MFLRRRCGSCSKRLSRGPKWRLSGLGLLYCHQCVAAKRQRRVKQSWIRQYDWDDETCQICFRGGLACSPAFTPCGHCYCESCLMLWLDSGNGCPTCRAAFPRSEVLKGDYV
ncbi:uncharacterized protein F5Z01DRAFT_669312, partial [Emericellopsis atlantica]